LGEKRGVGKGLAACTWYLYRSQAIGENKREEERGERYGWLPHTCTGLEPWQRPLTGGTQRQQRPRVAGRKEAEAGNNYTSRESINPKANGVGCKRRRGEGILGARCCKGGEQCVSREHVRHTWSAWLGNRQRLEEVHGERFAAPG
jgi:hypothetical protein